MKRYMIKIKWILVDKKQHLLITPFCARFGAYVVCPGAPAGFKCIRGSDKVSPVIMHVNCADVLAHLCQYMKSLHFSCILSNSYCSLRPK